MRFACHDGMWAVAAGIVALVALAVLLLFRRQWSGGPGGWGAGRGKSWRWWMAGVVLPVISALAVLLALAGVDWVHERPANVVLLVDFSASTRASPWRHPDYVRQLAASRLGNNGRVTVVGFGAAAPRLLAENLSLADRAAWPDFWPEESVTALGAAPDQQTAGGTGLAAALHWQRKSATADATARWIITDGLIDMNPATADGAPPDIAWTIIPPAAIDVAVRDVRVRPDTTVDGLEVLVQVRVVGPTHADTGGTSAAAVAARVEVFRDDRRIASQIVEFHPPAGSREIDSQRWISVKNDLADAGGTALPHRYTAVARLLNAEAGAAGGSTGGDGGDLWPENDRGATLWPGAAATGPKVLVVGEKPPPALLGAMQYVPTERFFGDARTWLAEGIQAIVLDDIPAEDLSDETNDAAATDPADISRSPLNADAARALQEFVEQTGGGLVILANGHAFGPGHYGEGGGNLSAGDILEALSPVASHPQTAGHLHVLFLLDASASMNEAVPAGGSGQSAGPQRKFTLLQQALAESIGLLAADDRLDLIAFNDHALPLFSGPAGDLRGQPDALSRELAGVHPQGPTVPDAVLDHLAQLLANGDSSQRRLVVFLTDGEIPAMNVDRWKNLITRSAAELCVVAPREAGAAPTPLDQLTNGLGDKAIWLKTSDPAQWAGVLRRALAAQVRGTVQHSPLSYQVKSDSAAPVRGIADPWTQVWPKPESQILLSGRRAADSGPSPPGANSPPAEPVLTAWIQRGLGRVGAMAMNEDDSPGYAAAYAALLQSVAANPGDRRFLFQAQRRDGAWLLTADAAEIPLASGTQPTPGFIDGQSLFARLILGDDRKPLDIPLPQTAPGHYQASIDLSLAPNGLSAAILRQPPHGPAQPIGHIQTANVQATEWPASTNPSPPPPHARILPASPTDPITWHPLAQTSHSLAILLWLTAMAAALLALLLRR